MLNPTYSSKRLIAKSRQLIMQSREVLRLAAEHAAVTREKYLNWRAYQYHAKELQER